MATVTLLLSLIGTACIHFTPISASGIRLLNTCSCLGQTVSFECVVTGGTLTVWSGTGFECSAGEITLPHINFVERRGSCNNEAIIGQGVTSNGNRYTSRLDVIMSEELIGRTITCSVENGTLNQIGSITLAINDTNTFPPPEEFRVPGIGPDAIAFSWSRVPHDGCPSFQYNITSENCGTCSPSLTTSNMSICANFSNELHSNIRRNCSFFVQSIICSNITGDRTSSLEVNLRVPDAPIVQIIPHYSDRTSSLVEVETNISVVDRFRIANDPNIDGAAVNYTVTYTEKDTGTICYSETIPTVLCGNEFCQHSLNLDVLSRCPRTSNITITVFATNILGNGQTSIPINIDGVNQVVNVMFNSSSRSIECHFLKASTTKKQCIANVTHGDNCDQFLGSYTGVGTHDIIATSPSVKFIDGVSEYCLYVIAITNNNTVVVEDLRINVLTSGPDQQAGTSSSVAVTVLIVLLIASIALVLGAVILWRLRNRIKRKKLKEPRYIYKLSWHRDENKDFDEDEEPNVYLYLDERGVNVEDKKYGLAPLIVASQNGDKDVVELLLDNGANVDQQNKYGLAPLIVASQNGHKEVVELLLDKGANVDQQNKDGYAALRAASSNGHTDVVRLLIARGATVDIVDKNGRTPLIVASQNGKKGVVELLLDKGATVDQQNKYGHTPLIVASQNGHKGVVELLLDKEATVDQQNKYGLAPLYVASQNGHKEVVELLLDKEATVDQQNKDGYTALHAASSNGHKDVVLLLITRGATVDIKDKYGHTPLIVASQNGHKEVVKLLLDKGANIDQQNKSPQTPPSRSWTRRKAIHDFNDPLRETCHDSFETDCSIKEFNSKFNELAIGEERTSEMVKLAGRIHKGELQESNLIIRHVIDGAELHIRADTTQLDVFNRTIWSSLNVGDIVGVTGYPKRTEGDNASLVLSTFKLLSRCVHKIPQQLISVLKVRKKTISFIRRFLEEKEFHEVFTPILNAVTGRAAANINGRYQEGSLWDDRKHYHMVLVGRGYERVYEIGKEFSNQEYTTCDFCMAYTEYKKLMEFTEKMISEMMKELSITGECTCPLSYHDKTDGDKEYKVDFKIPFHLIEIIPELEKHLKKKLQPSKPNFEDSLDKICVEHEIDCPEPRTSARMLEMLIEQFIVKQCTNPTFIVGHPQILCPLAKCNEDGLTECFELIVCQHKICKAYTNINSPKTLSEVMKKLDPQETSDDTVDEPVLEYGLPPCADWRMRIDPMVMILTDSASIKDVMLSRTRV